MIFLKLSEKNEFSKIEKCSILLFKAKYEEAEETLAFLNAEKQCNNDVVDDLIRENSSLKNQLKDLLLSEINKAKSDSAEIESIGGELSSLRVRFNEEHANQQVLAKKVLFLKNSNNSLKSMV